MEVCLTEYYFKKCKEMRKMLLFCYYLGAIIYGPPCSKQVLVEQMPRPLYLLIYVSPPVTLFWSGFTMPQAQMHGQFGVC